MYSLEPPMTHAVASPCAPTFVFKLYPRAQWSLRFSRMTASLPGWRRRSCSPFWPCERDK